MTKKYDLVGQDGNIFNVIGYVSNALRRTNHRDLIDEYRKKAMSSKSYSEALVTSLDYLDIANKGLKDDDDEEEMWGHRTVAPQTMRKRGNYKRNCGIKLNVRKMF